jgi:hypothetical protein
MVDKVIDKFTKSSEHKVSFVREITAKCFNDFLNKVPVNLQEKVCNYGSLVNNGGMNLA